MKNLAYILFLLFCLKSISIQAQNPDYPMGISFKVLMMDYQSQNGGDLTAFKEYHHGFEVAFHKQINEKINLTIPFKMGAVSASHQTLLKDLHKRVMGIDAQVRYLLGKKDASIGPYVFGGLGGVSEMEGEFNMQLPLGFGLNFRIAPNAFFTYQSEYRVSFGDDRNNLHHGLGFTYQFGGKKEMKDEEPEEEVEEDMMKDSDGDGLVDEVDLCPQNAGPKAMNGCPDMDSDGVADFEDVCPDVAGLKTFKGCPDSDGDGISDNDDECPEMPGTIENNGCPNLDRDSDGVLDAEDNCPDIFGPADNNGCPVADSDEDGIPDNIDKCPNSFGTAATDGCPDSDGDGVADADDKCPNKAGLKVYGGCPDSDNDGIDDSRDKCPNSAGPVSTGGCPEIAKEDKETLDIAMRAVQFDTGRSTLKSESNGVLRQIANILRKYPDYNLSISGHTDNTGSASANQRLSERRAKACHDYLLSQGIDSSRMSYAGYGESRPISDNNTLRGRSLNRRTEFNLIPR